MVTLQPPFVPQILLGFAEGDLFDIKSQDNLFAALQSKGDAKSLNLFIWSKQRKTITLYLDNLEQSSKAFFLP